MNDEIPMAPCSDSKAPAAGAVGRPSAGSGQTARFAVIGMTVAGILAGGARAQEAGSAAGRDNPGPQPPAPPPDSVTSLPPIEVTGTATNLPHDIPQSVATVGQQEIAEQGISSLQDVLRNVPGITLNAG